MNAIKYKYKVGDACATGQKINMILGQSGAACVYTTEDDNLRWEYFENNNQLPNSLMEAIATFDSLMVQISTLIPKRRQKRVYHRLGKALYSALDDGKTESIAGYFSPVQMHILQQSLHHARLVYLIASIVAGLLLTVGILVGRCLTEAYVMPGRTILGILFLTPILGIAGALVSILQRSGQLDVDPTSGAVFLGVQGFARVILGSLFGLFIALASKGNILLGLVSDNEFTLCSLGFVAGFSERLVPEVMRRMEAGQVEAGREGPQPQA